MSRRVIPDSRGHRLRLRICADDGRHGRSRHGPERWSAAGRERRTEIAEPSGRPDRRDGRGRPVPVPGARAGRLLRHGKALGVLGGRAHRPQGLARGDHDRERPAERLGEGRPRRDGRGPAIDTSRTTIGTNATLETMQRLPIGRNFVSIASTVSGTGSRRDRQHHGLRGDRPRERVHHRRRQHDRRQDGHAGEVPQQRIRPGGRGQDGRLRGRVRPRPRRDDQRRHEIGRQRVPRRSCSATTTAPGSRRTTSATTDRSAVEPGTVLHPEARRLRRGPRRLLREGPPLVLRRVRPREPGPGLHAHAGPDPRRVGPARRRRATRTRTATTSSPGSSRSGSASRTRSRPPCSATRARSTGGTTSRRSRT